jgi:ketosteroid isomerase-like protein
MTDTNPVLTTRLPAPVRAYLAAHAAGQAEAAIRAFAPDAVVVDDGRSFRGTQEVLDFLRAAGSQFDYTTELVGAERIDDAHWVAVQRLEGSFPGGVVELRFRFTVAGDLIRELVIAP